MSPDPAANDFPFIPGYEFLERIATTGMANVYHARELALNRDVAIKVLLDYVPLTGRNERFLNAARIQASLQHPGIPQVHHAGIVSDGRPFVVMNLIRGPYLNIVLAASRDLPRLVPIFRQACSVVGFAHSRGVVHRDIKTRNVMLGEHDEAHLIGWDLAFVPGLLTQELLARNPDLESSVMGTPAFMPPEQARGEQADERSDVFGLGGILCHILTGEPPFRGTPVIDFIQAAAAGDLSDAITRLDACEADPRLVALCKRCLDPNRANRPADGTAVARLVTQVGE